MSRFPCLLLFALAACGDSTHDDTAAAGSSGSGSSSGPGETGGPPTTGSGALTDTTDSTGGAEGGQTTGADPSSSGTTANDPSTSSTTGDATTGDATTGEAPLEHFLLGMDVQDV